MSEMAGRLVCAQEQSLAIRTQLDFSPHCPSQPGGIQSQTADVTHTLEATSCGGQGCLHTDPLELLCPCVTQLGRQPTVEREVGEL